MATVATLVGALGEQSDQNHEVGKGKEPAVGVEAGSFGRAGDEAEMTGLGEIVDVLDADARQVRNFRIGEDLLAGLYGDHGLAPRIWTQFAFQILRC